MPLADEAQDYLLSRGYTPELILTERLSVRAKGEFEAGPIRCHTVEDSVVFQIRTLSGRLMALHTAGIRIHDYRTFYDPAMMFAACSYCTSEDLQALWTSGEVIITEGVFDRIAVKRAFPERAVFARLTKGVSRPLVTLFERLARRVFLCFDMDSPGEKATARTIRALPDVKTIELRFSTKDPGQLYTKKGVNGVRSELGRQIMLHSF